MRAHSAAAWIAALFLATCLFSGTVALRLLLLLAGAAVCAWAAYRDRTIRVLPAIWLPFALWAGWAALSLFWSIDAERSLKEFRNEVVYSVIALWVCYVAAQASNALRVIASVLAIASGAACAIALYYFTFDFGNYPGGAHGGSGNHASVLLMLMPAVLVARLHWAADAAGPGWRGGLALALAALFAVSAYTTLNRTVWLGFGLQLILIMTLLRSSWTATRRGTLVLAGLSLAIAAGAAAVAWKTQVDRQEIGGRPLMEDPRLAIWTEAAEKIAERPLTGYGFGRGLLRRELTSQTNDNLAWHSHNLFLDALIQVGVPGLALLLALFAGTAWHGAALLRTRDPTAIACGVTLLAILAGVLVRNMTDVLWVRHVALLYWGLLGTLLAWGATARATRA